jgi:Ca-activated chloride channel family protein
VLKSLPWFILLGLWTIPTAWGGQKGLHSLSNTYVLSVHVNLVVLPVRVTDQRGDAVEGLNESNFQVFEDRRPQKIVLFEPQDVPVAVGLLVDESSSLFGLHPQVVSAVRNFIRLSNPHDEIFIVNFSDTASLGLPHQLAFSSDPAILVNALGSEPGGRTALYDAIALALRHVAESSNRAKALIVISDGGDTASHLTFRDVLRMAEASNIQIYTIGIFDPMETDQNPAVLKKLARTTGGEAYTPKGYSDIVKVCNKIARNLREEYVIGYLTHIDRGYPRHRTIRVVVSSPRYKRLHVRARSTLLLSS